MVVWRADTQRFGDVTTKPLSFARRVRCSGLRGFAAEEARAGRGAGSGARGGASVDWLAELEREEDWAREDKYDAAAFGVFMGSTGFSRFQGGLGEWGEWDEVYPQGMDFDDDD